MCGGPHSRTRIGYRELLLTGIGGQGIQPVDTSQYVSRDGGRHWSYSQSLDGL